MASVNVILPLEVCENVIDKLAEGLPYAKHHLSACALTCRTWLPRIRKHYFETMVLRNKNYINAKAILRKNPGLGLLVRRCDLELQDPGRAYFLREPRSCSITSLLLICITHFPNLQHLSLCFWAGLTREHGDIWKLFSYLPNVTTLWVNTEKGSSYTILCRLLPCFKSLQHLDIGGYQFKPSRTAPPSTLRRMKRNMKRLSIDLRDGSDDMVPLVTWFSRTQALHAVERLAIRWINRELKEATPSTVNWVMREVIKECGPSLTHFFMTYLPSGEADDAFIRHADLSLEANPGLHTIGVEFKPASMTAVLHLLATIVSKHVSRITLHYIFEKITSKPNAESWTLLDNILADGASFKSVTKVALFVRTPLHGPDRPDTDLLELLPKLCSRGILTQTLYGCLERHPPEADNDFFGEIPRWSSYSPDFDD